MNRCCGVCLLVALLTASLAAQDISGTIEGTVLDPSGAPVPNAKVTVTNVDRNQVVRTLTTDMGGNYSAPFIPIGNYDVKVEAAGFKTAGHGGIVLNARDNLKINVSLEVGATTESVEVPAVIDTVDLSTATGATTIEGTQIRELSLATRNYEQLVPLMPGVTASSTDELYLGVSSPAGTASALPYSINGNRNSANNWTVDGADNVDRAGNLTLLNFPSIDAISEFKVERSLYTADAGRAGGGQITVVTKSGGNQFHGSAYEFNRNDDYAANNWINNANRVNVVNGVAKVSPLRWNDFGYTIGGPFYLGRHYNKDKNKTFFFFSEEFRRIITYTTFQPTVPTTAMLQGSFPVPVCVSYTTSCQQTATQIAASQINPISAEYIKDIYGKIALPASSITGGFYPQRQVYNSRQELVRIDQNFTPKFAVWGRYLNDNIPTIEPGGLFTGSNIPNGATTSTNAPGRSFVIHALETFSPHCSTSSASTS
ncbi:MAG: carboxypeptidase regulatory-like domain-containing protein, partial [Acidobacteriia bacterium]|nr:carboxypeptidase regulatory-like domain-containing protein [Terriglobia bacterium]